LALSLLLMIPMAVLKIPEPAKSVPPRPGPAKPPAR
jgi:hypothetical protein